MKRIIITALAIATLAACTPTTDMIAAQKDKCSQIGYAPGTVAHAECTERGALQQQQTQDAVAGSILNAAIINAMLN